MFSGKFWAVVACLSDADVPCFSIAGSSALHRRQTDASAAVHQRGHRVHSLGDGGARGRGQPRGQLDGQLVQPIGQSGRVSARLLQRQSGRDLAGQLSGHARGGRTRPLLARKPLGRVRLQNRHGRGDVHEISRAASSGNRRVLLLRITLTWAWIKTADRSPRGKRTVLQGNPYCKSAATDSAHASPSKVVVGFDLKSMCSKKLSDRFLRETVSKSSSDPWAWS